MVIEMSRFVCPECEEEITGDEESEVIGKAMDHMEQVHEKNNFSARYAKGNIHAH